MTDYPVCDILDCPGHGTAHPPIKAKPYEGPFDPPPAESLDGAIAWRHVSAPDGPGRWKPNGWMIVFPDHILTLDNEGMGVRDSTLHAP